MRWFWQRRRGQESPKRLLKRAQREHERAEMQERRRGPVTDARDWGGVERRADLRRGLATSDDLDRDTPPVDREDPLASSEPEVSDSVGTDESAARAVTPDSTPPAERTAPVTDAPGLTLVTSDQAVADPTASEQDAPSPDAVEPDAATSPVAASTGTPPAVRDGLLDDVPEAALRPDTAPTLTRPGETPLDAAVRHAEMTRAAVEGLGEPADPPGLIDAEEFWADLGMGTSSSGAAADDAEGSAVEIPSPVDEDAVAEGAEESVLDAAPGDEDVAAPVAPAPERVGETAPSAASDDETAAAAAADSRTEVDPVVDDPKPDVEARATSPEAEPAVESAAASSAVLGDEEPEPASTAPDDTPVPRLSENAGRVVCVVNQKGGVGKTTTTISVAGSLAQQGARVLVIDLDPQGNATTGLGLRAHRGGDSIYRVLTDDLPIEDATEPTALRGLYVVPSTLDLAGAEIELVSMFSREQRMRDAVAAVRDLYDVILIDCPPSLGLLTINALTAADDVIVPIQCEYYALEGLGQLLTTVELVQSRLNPGLAIAGVVLTMFDGHAQLSHQVVQEVRDHFGDGAFATIIPRTVRLSEAPSYGLPITLFDPNSRGARSYTRLSREIAERLDLQLLTDENPLDRLLASRAQTPRDLIDRATITAAQESD